MAAGAGSWRTLALFGYRDPAARAAMLLAVPRIWSTSGMALTELPAMALAAQSVLATTEAVAAQTPRRAWRWWMLGGVATGLAILGRQIYLPAPPEIVARMPLGAIEKGIR